MDVTTNSVSGVCINGVSQLHVEKGLLVVQYFMIRIMIAWFKSVVGVYLVIRVGIGVIVAVVDHTLLVV